MNRTTVRSHPLLRSVGPTLLLLLTLLAIGTLYTGLINYVPVQTQHQPAAFNGAGPQHNAIQVSAPLTAATVITAGNALTTVVTLTATAPSAPPPTATLTPFVVTATATPESVLAAATQAVEMTANATIHGTAPATPENMLLATNTSTPEVVTNTPIPANAATLEAMALEATAIAFTTGTAAPPANVITATPTDTPKPKPSATWTVVYVTPTAPAADLYSAATEVVQATIDATTTGTATPLPANWKVANVRVLPYEPEPKNSATATSLAIDATARAITTGEPAGIVFWTATPKPTTTPKPTNTSKPTDTPKLADTPTVTATPADTPTMTATFFVVTATDTPESVLAAATLMAQMTSDAATTGTATPLPLNALLATKTPKPIIVTNTPTAENAATAAAMSAKATAIAFTTGVPDTSRFVTATPPEERVVAARPTNTPTPLYVSLADLTLTPTPEATPVFPAELVGKIFFLANLDRRGAPEAYAMDPDGTNVLRLSSREFYDRAAERDHYSADRRFYTFVQREPGEPHERQIFAYDAFYTRERQLTHFGDGSTSWDPVWSPTAELVAFVSNGSGNDEIWTIGRDDNDPIRLTENDKLWDKHPTFSPDGNEIAFMSNRSGQLEVWVMSKEGGNLRQLTNLGVPASDPVWVKYAE